MIRPGFRRHGACKHFLAGLLSVMFAVPASAQSSVPGGDKLPSGLTVTPLRIELDSQERSDTVTVNNGFDRPLAVQSRVFAWTQVNGEDVYAQSTDVTVTPSIVMIPAGESQIVRVLRKSAGSQGEKPYRLVIDELPDGAATDVTGTTTRIRFVLPLFVDRDKATPSKLLWRLTPSGLQLTNEGNATARIINVAIKTSGGNDVPTKGADLRYVLGASTVTFPFANGCTLGRVKVTAMVDGEPIDVEPVSACG